RSLASTPRPRISTLFPYTTLFRSPAQPRRHQDLRHLHAGADRHLLQVDLAAGRPDPLLPGGRHGPAGALLHGAAETAAGAAPDRSEEHTSELQSRENLVCRLLLEK